MNTTPAKPVLRVASPAGLLAVIPPLLGFTPSSSLVVVGATGPAGRVQAAFRYDLPDPPDATLTGGIAEHAASVLAAQHLTVAVVAGYGPGRLVTPLADALRRVLPAAGVTLQEIVRVDEGRYWSYLCHDPSCCPAEGVPFSVGTHPAAAMFAAVSSSGTNCPIRPCSCAIPATPSGSRRFASTFPPAAARP